MKATEFTWLAACAAAVLCAVPAAAQQKFPTKPVRMIVPFPSGAASDFLARVVGQKLADTYGQQVVIDNRPGAGGLIGSQIVLKGAADGYTLAIVGQPHVTNTLIHAKKPYDALKDFTSIGLVASIPNVIVIGNGVQAKTVGELVALAKAKPGTLNLGSAGVGSSSHLAGEMFQAAAGIQSVHVLKDADTHDRFQKQGADPAPGSPEAFRKLQADEYVRLGKLIKEIGMKPI